MSIKNLINQCWIIQHDIEDWYKLKTTKKVKVKKEIEIKPVNYFYDLYEKFVLIFFWEIIFLIFSISFWFFYYRSISFNAFDALRVHWLIYAILSTFGLFGLLISDFYDIYFYFKSKLKPL